MKSRRLAVAAIVMCSMVACARAAAAADQVIFIVRHAERADQPGSQPPAGMMANDPPLSVAGNERASRLAALLASADVRHIFTTEYLRARQTAAPLSQKTGIELVVSKAADVEALVQQVRKLPGNALIVGHTNTVPDLLKRLGVTAPVSIAENEYDNLFVVVRPAAGEPTLIRLRY
jgi:broad specificity phosphatase PhoE